MIYFTNCVEKDYGTDCEIFMVGSEPKPLDTNWARRLMAASAKRRLCLSSIS